MDSETQKTTNKEVKLPFDLTVRIIEYEEGRLDEDAELELFQHLVDTGLAWQLQGSYGRYAQRLLDAGLIQRK